MAQKKRVIVRIPATNPPALNPDSRPLNKKIVLGYSLVVKGSNTIDQIRQNILHIIDGHDDWKLTDVKTDYRKSESQDRTRTNFIRILLALKHRELDVLVIHSGGVLEYAIADASLLRWIFPYYNLEFYIIHENTMLPAKNYLRKLP